MGSEMCIRDSRYTEQVIEMELDPPKGLARMQLRASIEDLACDIQMSQSTIRNYVKGAFENIKQKAELAEDRGNTDYSQCDDEGSVQCDDVEAYQLYQRVTLDIETLRMPRNYFMEDAG